MSAIKSPTFSNLGTRQSTCHVQISSNPTENRELPLRYWRCSCRLDIIRVVLNESCFTKEVWNATLLRDEKGSDINNNG